MFEANVNILLALTTRKSMVGLLKPVILANRINNMKPSS